RRDDRAIVERHLQRKLRIDCGVAICLLRLGDRAAQAAHKARDDDGLLDHDATLDLISAGRRASLFPLTGYVLLALVDPDALVDELQRVGLAIIDAALHHAGAHHLVEEARHAGIGHRADAAL